MSEEGRRNLAKPNSRRSDYSCYGEYGRGGTFCRTCPEREACIINYSGFRGSKI